MKIVSLFVSILLAQAAGVVGSIFTVSSVRTWYMTLTLPSFSPPSWIFGPVWILLYTLMGIAAYLVWQQRTRRGVRRALSIYGIQLVLNALWSVIFFGLHRPDLALIEIMVLLAFILWTTVLFWRVDHRAGLLLSPYILWVSFAMVLNAAIWMLN
jgi:translocator protein